VSTPPIAIVLTPVALLPLAVVVPPVAVVVPPVAVVVPPDACLPLAVVVLPVAVIVPPLLPSPCRPLLSSCRLSPCFALPAAVADCYVFVTPSLDFDGAGRRLRHP